MSFMLLSRKVSMVREALNDWQLQSLERSFAKMTKSMSTQQQASMAGRGYLFIEVVFALLRHREWLEVPVFRALMIEFLQLDHGMPHRTAQTLVESMIQESTRLGVVKPRSLCVDDREFLNYAYVSAAGVRNDMELEMELGLGSAIIRKLRDGVRVLEDARVDVFIPEYDAMLASIVVELSHQSRERAWAMDEQRLKYKLLAELGDQSVPWILEEHLPQVLEALLDIGRGVFKGEHQLPLCEALEKARLVLRDRDGRGRVRGWDLTGEGAALTATLFKQRFGKETVAQTDAFLGMTLTWQVSLLEDKDYAPLNFIMELLSNHLSRMAPSAIEVAVGRVAALGATVLEPETVKALLGAAKLPWHKAAVLRALVEVAPSDELAGVVADALSVESSGSMVEAAGALLDRWGHNSMGAEG